jgi:diguanylate cyclase (GGDEF)-like protein
MDASVAEGVDPSLVEATLASGLRRLRFPLDLEAAFERETGRHRCDQLAIGAVIGIAMYGLALVNDWLVTPDIFVTALWLRLGVVMPILWVITARLFFNPSVFVREGGVAVGTLLAVASSLYLMLLSDSPLRENQFQYMILAILYATVVQRARFVYAVASCLGCFALYSGARFCVSGHSLTQVVSANLILGGAVFMALVGAYMLEREQRLNYVLSLRGRLQNRELDAISRRDPLTGLGNRRSLDEALTRWESNCAENDPLAVILLDIDRFKLFNDAAGHLAGDACLEQISGVLESPLLHAAAQVFRYGGEEFLILLPGADLAAGVDLAEEVRRAIEAAAIPHPAPATGPIVTASFGVGCTAPGPFANARQAIANADAALYAAKHNGRNQVWPPMASARRIATADPLARAS